jgi:hypothetical protein
MLEEMDFLGGLFGKKNQQEGDLPEGLGSDESHETSQAPLSLVGGRRRHRKGRKSHKRRSAHRKGSRKAHRKSHRKSRKSHRKSRRQH